MDNLYNLYIYILYYIIVYKSNNVIKWYPWLPRYGMTCSGPCGHAAWGSLLAQKPTVEFAQVTCSHGGSTRTESSEAAAESAQGKTWAAGGCRNMSQSFMDWLGWWWFHCAIKDVWLMCVCVRTACCLVMMIVTALQNKSPKCFCASSHC